MILCDKQLVVNITRSVREQTHELLILSRTALGSWQLAVRDFLEYNLLPDSFRVECIKAHEGFQGNEMADSFAKWASFAYTQPFPVLPLGIASRCAETKRFPGYCRPN